MVIVSAAHLYDPEGVGGLGTKGHGERGGRSLRGIGGPPIPPQRSHIITKLVSAVRRYRWFLFIKSQQYNLVSAARRYQGDFFISEVADPVVSAGRRYRPISRK